MALATARLASRVAGLVGPVGVSGELGPEVPVLELEPWERCAGGRGGHKEQQGGRNETRAAVAPRADAKVAKDLTREPEREKGTAHGAVGAIARRGSS